MHRTTGLGTFAGCARAVLLFAVSVCLVVSVSGESFATDTKVFLFNLNSSNTYSVVKNSALLVTVNSSQNGLMQYGDAATAGDQYQVSESSGNPQPPSAPTGLASLGDDTGCAHTQWDANPELDVDFYRVYYGATSVAGGGASSYDDSLDVLGAVVADVCGLPDGTYFFAVRAHNTAGMLSTLSPEVGASVSNGNTQPPLPPLVVTAAEGSLGCIDVSWVPNSSPEVVGYLVDYGTQSVEGGGAAAYQHTVDVGNASSHTICQLPEGTYYVAVRSKNFAGMASAYSIEQSADVSPVAVFIAAFSAQATVAGVELKWKITTDEDVRGYRVYRAREAEFDEVELNDGLLIDPSRLWFVDTGVDPSTGYRYALVVVDEDGVEHRSQTMTVTTLAWSLSLDQNVPNPFNPTTAISFVVPEASRARLVVYDVTGAVVRILLNEFVPAGRKAVHWDGTNDIGQTVSTGHYFYRLVVGGRVLSRKMLLLK
jgi:hypothetical protein